MKSLSFSIIAFLMLYSAAFAAQIKVEKLQTRFGIKEVAIVHGKIEAADLEKFKKVVRGDPNLRANAYDPTIPRIVEIYGTGGDYDTAMKIARLVQDKIMSTYVPSNKICEGPCAIILMAGVQSSGDDYIDRYRCLQEGSRVTFGTPDITNIIIKSKADGTLSRETRKETLRFIIDFIRLSDEHEWPVGLLDAILDQDQIVSMTPESRDEVGSDLFDFRTFKKDSEGC